MEKACRSKKGGFAFAGLMNTGGRLPGGGNMMNPFAFHEFVLGFYFDAKPLFDKILLPWQHLRACITTDEEGDIGFYADKYCYSIEELKNGIKDMEFLANNLQILV